MSKQDETDAPSRPGGSSASPAGPSRGLRRAARVSRSGSLELNIIPLADVTFLLMVFFVIAGTFRFGEGILNSRLPSIGSARAGGISVPLPLTPITVRVQQTGPEPADFAMSVEGVAQRPASFSELAAILRDLQQQAGFDAESLVVIRSDADVQWDHVVNCLNAAKRAGYANVAFAAR